MSTSLKINVATIPEEGLNFVLSEDGRRFEKCFEDSASADFSLRKIDVRCQVTKASSTIYIKGNLALVLGMNCSRCLEEVNIPVSADFAYSLLPAQPEVKADLELTVEELDISYYSGDFIDLTPIICEQIILQIPIKPLCSKDCKGLCPQCGINRNTNSCSCHTEFIDERLAVLKNFKIKN
jgi:uncharacterized protein